MQLQFLDWCLRSGVFVHAVGVLAAYLLIYALSLPREDRSKAVSNLIGCALLAVYGGLGRSPFYFDLEVLAVVSCVFPFFPRTSMRVRFATVSLLAMVVVALLIHDEVLRVPRTATDLLQWFGAASLLALSVGFATLRNRWFLWGGLGIMTYSFLGVALDFSWIGIIFGVLNVIFSHASYKAVQEDKRDISY